MDAKDLQTIIRDRYGKAARQARDLKTASCCGPSSCCGNNPVQLEGGKNSITDNLYSETEVAKLPQEAVLASLGCGNPSSLADLKPGEIVLDLGSGGGVDVLLSARRVAPHGRVYGIDMTDEMLALAEENRRRAGVQNVEFLKGTIEDIPLPDGSVDVIISNCVINLSGDKDAVFREAYRVLRPGGRLAISDIIALEPMPPEVQRSLELWAGCLAGALVRESYEYKLARAGFTSISIEPTRVYRAEDTRDMFESAGFDVDGLVPRIDGKFAAAFIRARKPETA